MSIQLICLIVVAALAVKRVLDLTAKKKMADKAVLTERGDELVVRDEARLVPDQVRKAFEKAKAASEQREATTEQVNDNRGAA